MTKGLVVVVAVGTKSHDLNILEPSKNSDFLPIKKKLVKKF